MCELNVYQTSQIIERKKLQLKKIYSNKMKFKINKKRKKYNF